MPAPLWMPRGSPISRRQSKAALPLATRWLRIGHAAAAPHSKTQAASYVDSGVHGPEHLRASARTLHCGVRRGKRVADENPMQCEASAALDCARTQPDSALSIPLSSLVELHCYGFQ